MKLPDPLPELITNWDHLDHNAWYLCQTPKGKWKMYQAKIDQKGIWHFGPARVVPKYLREIRGPIAAPTEEELK